MEFFTGLAWIDQVGAVLLLVFTVLGAVRGLWAQVLRLVGLGTAIVVATATASELRPLIEEWAEELQGPVAHTLAWLVAFVGVLLLVALLAKLGQKALEAMELGTWDRVGGAVAGAATGLALHALILVLLGFGPEGWAQGVLEGTWSSPLERAATARLRGVLEGGEGAGAAGAAASGAAQGTDDQEPAGD